MPVYRFPYRVEVWDVDGNVVKQVADLPLAEEIPIAFGAVATGPRSFGWRADVPATLCWVEAQDGGDPKAEAEIRDNLGGVHGLEYAASIAISPGGSHLYVTGYHDDSVAVFERNLYVHLPLVVRD